MQLYKFSGPKSVGITLESLGGNLPFELGPWSSAGTITIDEKGGPVNGRAAADIICEVEAAGFAILPVMPPTPPTP
ncbi:MAG TPA: hypothetical protein VGG69_08780 [Rhizomicrobium sp.]